MKNFFLWGVMMSVLASVTRAQDGSVLQSRTDVATVTQEQLKQDTILSLSSNAASGGENMCGDGVTRNGEQCDDGNYDNGDGCDSNCKVEIQSMAINEKGLPGNSCPKGCRWNRWVHDCRCAAGVQQQAKTSSSGTGKNEYVGHVTLIKREMPVKPKRITILIEDEDISSSIVSPRDPASGQATGKRTMAGTGIGPDIEPDIDLLMDTGPCKPPYLCESIEISRDLDEDASQKSKEDVYVWKITSPRDSASGLPTGKRVHKPITISQELDKKNFVLIDEGSGENDVATKLNYPILPAWTGRLEETPLDDDITMEMKRKGRDGTVKGSAMIDDYNSSRSNTSRVAISDLDGDGTVEVVSPRDAASGLPTGKRQYKPYRLVLEPGDCDDDDCDMVVIVEADLDADGIYETRLGLNGLPPGQSLGLVHRTKHDTVKNSISNIR